jgi:hypothetical protein
LHESKSLSDLVSRWRATRLASTAIAKVFSTAFSTTIASAIATTLSIAFFTAIVAAAIAATTAIVSVIASTLSIAFSTAITAAAFTTPSPPSPPLLVPPSPYHRLRHAIAAAATCHLRDRHWLRGPSLFEFPPFLGPCLGSLCFEIES